MSISQLELQFSDQSGIHTFEEVEDLFRAHGVGLLYIKELALKQDNEKNQIYLVSGGDANSIVNTFDAKVCYRSPSKSTRKRKSRAGDPKVEMLLDFYWLNSDGSAYPAPRARIINYFQFPEARLSGFLSGCQHPPDALRRDHQAAYGKRVLLLGINHDGATFGLVLTEKHDPLTLALPDLKRSKLFPALFEHVIGGKIGKSPRELLIDELSELSGIWHPSVTLRRTDPQPIPFKGNQGAGFTLEALLGVPRNADKAPDKYGFELKTFKPSGRISLMTPTADLGAEGDLSFRDFMDSYGWTGARHSDRKVFNGTFKFHEEKTTRGGDSLVLDLAGFNSSYDALTTDAETASVNLCHAFKKDAVSGWSFQKLLEGWQDKHSSAAYVEYEKRPFTGQSSEHDFEYRFTGRVMACEGTSIWNFIQAIASKTVYYDPGHEIRPQGEPKQRPQWRISVTRSFHAVLDTLYDSVDELNLPA